jgi:alpha-glucosidase
VWADLDKTLRFWLDRGVDGFRIEAAHGMCKDVDGVLRSDPMTGVADPRFDTDDVHDVHRMIRAALDHYPERVAVGALGVRSGGRFARYVRPDELHLAVDTGLAAVRFDADELRATIEDTLRAVQAVGAAATWALSDHDVTRLASRYGTGPAGLARARAMALVQLALPGAVFLYNGDELGLPDADLPDDARRDGVWSRIESGRDGCRVPQPWEADQPAYGFTTGTPWLPLPAAYAPLAAADQLEDTRSTLSLYRRGLELRRWHPGFAGTGLEWFGAPRGCLAFRRAGTTLVCALNTSPEPVPLPPGDPLLVSGPLDGDMLPPDTAAWLA